MNFIEYTWNTLLNTVATSASPTRLPNRYTSVINSNVPLTKLTTKKMHALSVNIQYDKRIDDKVCALLLLIATIYEPQASPDATTITTPATLLAPGIKASLPPSTPKQYIPTMAIIIAIALDTRIFSLKNTSKISITHTG
jgi:hypothetical protein